MKHVHVFDARRGRPRGGTATLREITSRHPDLPIGIVSGGLSTGPGRVPIRALGHVQGADAGIAEPTGATFGQLYGDSVADGSFALDSGAAARGVAPVRQVAPDRAAEPATAVRHAFSVDGPSLSEALTYRTLARAAGLNADAVVAALEAPGARTAARAGLRRAARFGVTGFPTPPAVDGDSVTPLAHGHPFAYGHGLAHGPPFAYGHLLPHGHPLPHGHATAREVDERLVAH
ncbi:DsbA family protein [Streptomyces sp. NPDC006259]|uniref:DsbA family protein n=1 Tax=Streptomyces sp. NPDC006259 TaxID=3364740 RepID=UPI0036853D0F